MLRLLVAVIFVLLPWRLGASELDRRVSVTFDDLPWAGPQDAVGSDGGGHHAALMAALRIAGVRGAAFVNEGKLEVAGRVRHERVRMLRDWLDAGWELGNHTWGHVDLHAVGMQAYTADILRGEARLKTLLAERDARPRWFRHPYLRAGRSAQDKAALAAFLASHGYRIAPVTIDNSDWIWARAYAVALRRDDLVTAARLRQDFVPYMVDRFAYFERQSRALLGREPPQVLLLHANELNAATFVALADAIRARGYRFVDLEETLSDPAYARPDGYTGAYGPSWLHRWAMAEGRPRSFYAGEPETPRWVLDLAGVAAE